MSGQDAFRRFAQQVQRAGGSGGRVPPGGSALVAGAIALIGGGALLNASLFNGEYPLIFSHATSIDTGAVDGGHRAIKYTR